MDTIGKNYITSSVAVLLEPLQVLPIAAYQQDTRTLIESDGNICCLCTTMSS